MDKLVEIPLDDLIALREKYLLRLADQGLGFFILNNYIKWLQQDPNVVNFHAYSLNGDWSDGTFVTIVCAAVIHISQQIQSLSIY